MNPPSVPSSLKLPENNIEACEQAAVLARAARRAVSRVQDAVITAQVQTIDESLANAMTALDHCVREIEEITAARREGT